ncbi:MAG: hypothetical protein LBJ90_02015 [Treponema sp.]|nr:hypothetical protein [Treponema sp.]
MADRDSSGGKNTDTGEAVFYYSREHRLKRASPAVRALYDDAPGPGIVRNLIGKKSNLFLLVSIFMVCVMLALSSRSGGSEKGVDLGGNTVALAIVRNDRGTLSVFIQKTAPPSGEVYTGEAAIAVSPVISKQDKGKAPEIYTDKFFFTPAEKDEYRFELPFEGKDFLVVLQAGTERKGLRLKAGK